MYSYISITHHLLSQFLPHGKPCLNNPRPSSPALSHHIPAAAGTLSATGRLVCPTSRPSNSRHPQEFHVTTQQLTGRSVYPSHVVHPILHPGDCLRRVLDTRPAPLIAIVGREQPASYSFHPASWFGPRPSHISCRNL